MSKQDISRLKDSQYFKTPSGDYFVTSDTCKGILPEVLDELLTGEQLWGLAWLGLCVHIYIYGTVWGVVLIIYRYICIYSPHEQAHMQNSHAHVCTPYAVYIQWKGEVKDVTTLRLEPIMIKLRILQLSYHRYYPKFSDNI